MLVQQSDYSATLPSVATEITISFRGSVIVKITVFQLPRGFPEVTSQQITLLHQKKNWKKLTY